MNWSKNSSIELSRICVVLFMILLAALDIGCYWAVQWFVEIRLMYWQYGVLMMVTIYLCSGFGWVLLVRLWQLLQNIREQLVFDPKDVRLMRQVRRCWVGAGGGAGAGAGPGRPPHSASPRRQRARAAGQW